MMVMPATQEQYFRIPAHRFNQGRRSVFTFALTLEQLDGMLPQRIDEDVVREANRRLTPSHARVIETYLDDHSDDWISGSILVGIDPNGVEFEGFPDEDGNVSQAFGQLKIPFNRLNTLRLFDGQHRRRAIQDLLTNLREKESGVASSLNSAKRNGQNPDVIKLLNKQLVDIRSKRESLQRQSVPIVLYLEGEIKALQRMFSDAAKTKPIEAITKARFDDRDPFNLAAAEVMGQSEFLRDRIDMERSTVARTAPYLLSFNQLAVVLKTLMVGYGGRISRVRNDEFMADYEPVIKRSLEWADDFMPSSCEEYDNLLNGDVEASEFIPDRRRETFAFNATIIRVLAGCFYSWQVEVGEDTEPMARYIRKHSFENTIKRSLWVRAGLVAEGGTTPVARAQEVRGAIRFIVDNAKKSLNAK
ncbi:MAG: hypothetical protein F4X57_06925 [Chloroflexi bacterium]|nr:hypothetical protein [Chloroflexota bacterium]